jgi:transposase
MTTLLSTVESIPQGQLSNSAYSIVGVDVAKRKLDLYLLDKNESLKIPNQTEDITRVFNLLSKNSQRPLLVAMEATGGYELTLLNALVAAKIACTVLNPVRVRQFALGCGLLEKSDKIDAAIIAQHAHIRPPKLYVPREESALQLSEFCTHRERLLAALQQEKNRLESSFLPKLRTLITKHCCYIKKQIRKLEDEINLLMENNHEIAQKNQILTSVPGVGTVTSAVLIARLPELGSINRQKVAKLVGVSPIIKESGTKQGVRKIYGGRRDVRRALYMAALVATRHNPVIKDLYCRLLARGKEKKKALVACMRKLLTILNTLLKKKEHWTNKNIPVTAQST